MPHVPQPFDVIADATRCLHALLQGARGPGGPLSSLAALEIAVPTESYSPHAQPALTIYLYRVVENTHGRNRDRVRMPTGPTDDPARFVQTEPPLMLDLHYLLVPWGETHLQEQEVLGRTMQYLYDNRAIPESFTSHTFFAEQEAQLSLHLETGVDFSFESLARLWEVTGRKHKLAVSYKMRGVRIESARTVTGSRVLERATDYYTGPPVGEG